VISAWRTAARAAATHRNERGSLTAFTAVMAVALLALAGLVIDGGSAIASQRHANDVAEQAARAGADALSVDALREGSITVNPRAAITAAQAYLVASRMAGTVAVTGNVVTVDVTGQWKTVLLGIVGIGVLHIAAQASATDVNGITAALPANQRP